MTRFLRTLGASLVLLALSSCGGGVGSGGTGILVGGGVGSGGTGISLGPISGFGSIVVNGVRHDVDSATLELDDAPALGLGMLVEVSGTIDGNAGVGVATRVRSAADLRGPLDGVDPVAGTLDMQGTQVSTDTATVFVGTQDLTALAPGDPVMVHGLPVAPGQLRATRIERLAAPALPIVTGVISGLNPAGTSFTLGALSIQYGAASFIGGLAAGQLADGLRVRVRAASAPVAGVLTASSVQAWYGLSAGEGSAGSVSGVVTDFGSLASFKLLGQPVDASQAQVTGGPAGAVGNGVRVEVEGTVAQGVLVATRLRIRHVPGSGGPVSFSLEGTVGAFVSSANFRVTGQPVDASGPAVVFTGGAVGGLGNGVKVRVQGSQVVNGALVAESVMFLP